MASEYHFLVTALRRATTAPDGVLADRAGLALSHAAQELDRLILGPLRRDVGDRRLVVVPTGCLHEVPWSALPQLSARPVSVAPSASMWHRAATSAVSAHGHDVLAVAGPRLAAAQDEVSDVVRLRGGAALTGPAAAVETVLAGLSGADTVHIAAHGRLRVDNPLLSSLEMFDGPLTVYDLERLPQVPRLVLLPACQSGSSRVHSGDEVLGLAHALLAFGARAIVATVVAVPDTQTREFMAGVHAGLASGRTPSEALAGAQDASADAGLRAAATASAFVCFGAGTSG